MHDALDHQLVLSDCLASAIAQKQAWVDTLQTAASIAPSLSEVIHLVVQDLRETLGCERALVLEGQEAEWILKAEAVAPGIPSCMAVGGPPSGQELPPGQFVPLLSRSVATAWLGKAGTLELMNVVDDTGEITTGAVRAWAEVRVHLPTTHWLSLVVQQVTAPRAWSTSDLRFLLQAGFQVGIALQRESWLMQAWERMQTAHTNLMGEWQKQLERVALEASREQAIASVLDRIRRSLSLAEIFQTTATEARAILRCDRVAMFRFLPESNYTEGCIVSEAIIAPYRSALHHPVIDHCFADRRLDDYLHGRIWSVADIETVPMADCYRAILQQFEVRANLVVPLLNGTELWGLLCAHQCGSARNWATTDIDFVQRLAEQLSVALQQSTLLEKAEAARSAADRASRAKSEFLASMSHELRTPLNAILGLSQLLKAEANLTERQREWLMTINQSGEHLLSLISDVLEMSKIEAGKISLEETCFELSSALEGLLDLIAIKTLNKNVTLSYQPAPNLPRFVQTDRKKLSQVLLNLLSNALKFTEQGKVVLRVQQETGSGQSDCWLSFTVQDTGIGIPPENLEVIFQPFERGGAQVQQYEGTGLGLAIARRFVELMGGQLTVQSEVGRGTTFGFRIRVKTPSRLMDTAPPALTAKVASISSPRPWVRVLVVEDNAANREVLRSMLETLGYRCDVVASGQAALQQLTTQSYEIVLMDIQMPEMDGLQTTQHIYETLPVERQPLVIAVTAGVQPTERQKCLAVGMCDFLPKPVRLEELQAMLTRWTPGAPVSDP
ncbi:MAG: ATP-binding protein [Pseudanabaenaceae cyanobacterium]